MFLTATKTATNVLQMKGRYKFMRLFKRILGFFTAIMAISYFAMSSSQEKPTLFVVLGIIMIVFTFLLFLPTKKDKQKKEGHKKDRKERMKTCTMKHVNGLPIAENVNCTITSSDDKFIFSSGSMHFELYKSKITDMCIKTDKEIQKQYVSSVGGAVGGAVLFGPVGAIIGGRAKKKTVKKETHNYLIITYQSPDIKYIGFEIGYALASANLYIEEFKNKHISESTYQL